MPNDTVYNMNLYTDKINKLLSLIESSDDPLAKQFTNPLLEISKICDIRDLELKMVHINNLLTNVIHSNGHHKDLDSNQCRYDSTIIKIKNVCSHILLDIDYQTALYLLRLSKFWTPQDVL